ncbi:MAG: TetR/AcrR family transcriptional regulator [Anaerolineales bacterium]|nr:TetR/AcrR family transcriptional regulator [Anaerolineales bacterium]
MTQSYTQSRRERERQERRAAILDAARQVFFTQGIYQTTMDDVATAAEVSKGTVYLYFETKETILALLLQEGLALLIQQLDIAYNAEKNLPAPTRLRFMAKAYFQFFQSYPHYYRLLIMFERRKFQESVDPKLYEHTLMRSTRGLAYVIQALEQGIDEGIFHVEDPKRSASVLWAMLHGVYVILGHPLRKEMLASDLESLYDSAVELAIKGLMSK